MIAIQHYGPLFARLRREKQIKADDSPTNRHFRSDLLANRDRAAKRQSRAGKPYLSGARFVDSRLREAVAKTSGDQTKIKKSKEAIRCQRKKQPRCLRTHLQQLM